MMGIPNLFGEEQTGRCVTANMNLFPQRCSRPERPHAKGVVMPQKTWSARRERQYLHIRDGLLDRGRPEPLAEEIAARVVNKERAQHGESVDASPSSLHDISSGRRGGLRSHKGPGGRTLMQLRNEARQRGVKGRSTMNKAQLEAALAPSR